jgi:hypothetical protein
LVTKVGLLQTFPPYKNLVPEIPRSGTIEVKVMG